MGKAVMTVSHYNHHQPMHQPTIGSHESESQPQSQPQSQSQSQPQPQSQPQHIRSKLLNRLGIYKSSPMVRGADRRKHVIRGLAATTTSIHSPLGHRRLLVARRTTARVGVSFRLPLNDNPSPTHSVEDTIATSEELLTQVITPPSFMSSSVISDDATSIQLDRSIQFQEEVLVMPIPSHSAYSHRMKKFLWNSTEEISENAERNRIEFAAEGWDWHSVVDNDEMFVDAQSGELVHPVWLEEELGDDNGDTMMMDNDISEPTFPTLTRSHSFVNNLQELTE